MKLRSHLPIVAVAAVLAACAPAAEYSDSEAPNVLTLDRTSAVVGVHFAPGSDRLMAADAVRLHRLAAAGAIATSDRVTVAAGGDPDLAAARRAAVAAELLPYGVVVSDGGRQIAPLDQAVLVADRTLVRTPDCPNWSKSPAVTDFTNTVASNFGCATVTNLARMVAYPTDLATGQPVGFNQGTPAVAAVGRYQADKIFLPPASNQGALTITAPAAQGAGAVGGGATANADVTANQ